MTEQLHFHFSLSCIGEGNGTHSSVLAWRIPGTGEPGGLPSAGSWLKHLSSSSSSRCSFILASWKVEGGRVGRTGKILSDIYEIPCCSPLQITLNTTTVSSWLGSRSSIAEYKHTVLTQSLLTSVEPQKDLLREEVAGPLVAIQLLLAPALSLHLLPFLITCSLVEASAGSICSSLAHRIKCLGFPAAICRSETFLSLK